MQLYCLQTARLAERGALTDTLAGLAKLHNTAKARTVPAEARDLLGGNGTSKPCTPSKAPKPCRPSSWAATSPASAPSPTRKPPGDARPGSRANPGPSLRHTERDQNG
jgi:hypothetical protein